MARPTPTEFKNNAVNAVDPQPELPATIDSTGINYEELFGTLGPLLKDLRSQELKDKLAFDREQMKEAAKYEMLFGFPQNVADAIEKPGIIGQAGAASVANIQSGTRVPVAAPFAGEQSAQVMPNNTYSVNNPFARQGGVYF